MSGLYTAVSQCWVCDGRDLDPVHVARMDLARYACEDPELARYDGGTVALNRCRGCGFAQPASMPTLPRFFDRLYDQRWSEEWVAREHQAVYKDLIFTAILDALETRVPDRPRRLLDVGAHAGRFLTLARARGWEPEGLELNTRTARYAAAQSGAPVHQVNAHAFDPGDRRFHAVVLTDVLEHVPEPVTLLRRLRDLLTPSGWVAIKVPSGPNQRLKEAVRERVRPGYHATLAENLVHVNHFSPRALGLACQRAGFVDIALSVAPPELPDGAVSHVARMLPYTIARLLPGGVHLPFAFNLQVYARRD
jgi:SAM-dependent methyltransferase